MARKVRDQVSCPVTVICSALGISRSGYYYQGCSHDDHQLVSSIKAVQTRFPTYGTRRVTAELKREPEKIHVNRKRVQRLMRQYDLLQPVKKRKVRTTNSQHSYPRYPNLVKDKGATHPDEIWVSDITYIRLGTGFVYLAVIMDMFTRDIRGWQLSRSIDQRLTLDALRMALQDHVPEIHHSDQGVQYAAGDYTALLVQHQIKVSMAAIGKAEENGYAERLMRTIKEEEVDLSEYTDFTDAFTQIGYFIEEVYRHKRIHSSLGYLTPAEFEDAWVEQQRTP
jgi:putative transposase